MKVVLLPRSFSCPAQLTTSQMDRCGLPCSSKLRRLTLCYGPLLQKHPRQRPLYSMSLPKVSLPSTFFYNLMRASDATLTNVRVTCKYREGMLFAATRIPTPMQRNIEQYRVAVALGPPGPLSGIKNCTSLRHEDHGCHTFYLSTLRKAID